MFAQTQDDIKKITANYDLAKLKEKENFFKSNHKQTRKKLLLLRYKITGQFE